VPSQRPKPKSQRHHPWRSNEESRRRQLREDGRRSLAENLTEGLAFSEFIFNLPEDQRPPEHEALEVFRAAQMDGAAED
jgi:hypothetical protein